MYTCTSKGHTTGHRESCLPSCVSYSLLVDLLMHYTIAILYGRVLIITVIFFGPKCHRYSVVSPREILHFFPNLKLIFSQNIKMRICHANIELSERDLNIILEDFKGQKKKKIKFLSYMYIRLTADLA